MPSKLKNKIVQACNGNLIRRFQIFFSDLISIDEVPADRLFIRKLITHMTFNCMDNL